MNKSLLLLMLICSISLLDGCGSATPPPPPLVATHFSVTAATTPQIAGTAFNITVTALDASNVLVSTYTGTVHFASSDIRAVLPANSPLANGTGTFSVMLKTPAAQTVTVSDAAGTLTPGTSNSISVSAAAASQFSVTAPATATVGTAFNLTVTAQDPFSNTATTYSGTLHFTSKDGQATMPANASLSNGTGTFSATFKTEGSQTVTATDTATSSITGTSSSITVSGAATHFTVTAPVTATIGTAFGLTVTALDAANNVAMSYAGTVHFSSTDGQALLPADSPLTNGIANFSATMKTLGNQLITATDKVTASLTGASSSINVIPLPPLEIISGQPPDGVLNEGYGGFREICATGSTLNGFELEARGGQAGRLGRGYTWVGSSLPPGLKVSSITLGGPPICPQGTVWVIDGTPTASGTYTFSVAVTDLETPPVTVSATYTIKISDPAIPIIETTPPPVVGTLNSPYAFTFTAIGGFPPLTWSETGALPPGILPLSSSGVLSGTPTAAGSYPITVQVQDSHGRSSAPQNFNIQVLAQGFKPTGNLATARVWHTATLFRSGLVLVTGGVNTTSFPVTAELFNPAQGTFATTAGSMNSIRVSPTANLLQDGKVVLVAGGKDASGNGAATAELFDSTAGTFKPTTGSMQTARVYHTGTLLADGTVLLTGGLDATGNPTATAELFDPATGTFSSVGNMSSVRFLHAATLLASGKVLVTGGLTFGSAFGTAELYDPASKTFTLTGNMTVARAGHTATALANGKILVAGGASRFAGNSLASSELFDPATGTFTATGNMVTPRSLHTATVRNDGTVLVAGGDTGFYNGFLQTLSAVELFDPTTGTFTSVADMTTPRESHTATLLLNGEVLIVGGSVGTLGYSVTTTVLASAETYQ
jgi:hypothetical protein